MLVVVGDVTPEEVFTQAEEAFGAIPADTGYKHETFYHTPDLNSGAVTIIS